MADKKIETFVCKKCKTIIDVVFNDIDDFRSADTQIEVNIQRKKDIKEKKCEKCGNIGFKRFK